MDEASQLQAIISTRQRNMDGPDVARGAAQQASIKGRSMAVLYGTETGSAEEIAVEIGQMAERLHFKTTVDEMDSFKLVRVAGISPSPFLQAR